MGKLDELLKGKQDDKAEERERANREARRIEAEAAKKLAEEQKELSDAALADIEEINAEIESLKANHTALSKALKKLKADYLSGVSCIGTLERNGARLWIVGREKLKYVIGEKPCICSLDSEMGNAVHSPATSAWISNREIQEAYAKEFEMK